jgi:hypothetical protein
MKWERVMSKYSNKQLRKMAKEVLAAKKAGDVRCIEFIMRVSLSAGCSPQYVDRKIEEYISGEGNE